MANERAGGPPRLGELERAVMDVLWNAPDGTTAQEIVERLAARDGTAELATTTVLTVLDRLRRKDFVTRERAGRAHRYRAARTRDDVIASSMLAVLETTEDRRSALVRFAGAVSAEEAALLRAALAELEE
ncbi:BlaI/MecI/CopY family transcriptional regulator [Catenulispora pinisilvae]|uniref:BlaI/MecI/CopY family transcriptional regulator n=1 Tax=Catenulispora pinisilvae TaxID=2705253 RepID=UPI0018912C12|nr:BlaI/MecI/CopY family transcriptional regulator [Catenulispora pinisilvae]